LLKLGLTGGIAAGKSVVGEMLVTLGAHLIQADAISHQLMQPGGAVYREVIRAFGSGILNPDGSVNRARLAAAAFGGTNQPSRILELNKIVHPAVIERQDEWMQTISRRDPKAIAIVEAALILEAGAEKHFDRLLVVTCRPEQRAERWAARTKVDLETARQEVARRMAAQLPDEEKIKAADYVIDNSGSIDHTRAAVAALYPKLRAEAERKNLQSV
jgi:dephospho-CoA kinase